MREILSKVGNFIASLLIFAMFAMPLHEAGHSFAAQCFGISGYIKMGWLTYGTFYYDPGQIIPMWQDAIINFAGGGLVALILALLLIFANIGMKWDEDDQSGLRCILGLQLGYAIGEIFLVYGSDINYITTSVGSVLGISVAIVYSLPKLIRWWEVQ